MVHPGTHPVVSAGPSLASPFWRPTLGGASPAPCSRPWSRPSAASEPHKRGPSSQLARVWHAFHHHKLLGWHQLSARRAAGGRSLAQTCTSHCAFLTCASVAQGPLSHRGKASAKVCFPRFMSPKAAGAGAYLPVCQTSPTSSESSSLFPPPDFSLFVFRFFLL